MDQITVPPTKKTRLEEVKEQFQNWRITRQHRSQIPKQLWQAAIDLSSEYTVNTLSKTLCLSYSDLKRRIKAADLLRADTHRIPPHFVEFNIDTEKTGECIVEMENTKGNRMKIQLKGCSGDTIVDLAKALWRVEK